MKIRLLILFFLSLTSCVTAPLMRENYFNQLPPGCAIEEIRSRYGEPYEVVELENGIQRYTYIQRIQLGNAAVEQLDFIFLVKNGKVIDKMCKQNGTSHFQFVQ